MEDEKVCVIPIAFGPIGMVAKDYRKSVERLKVPAKIEVIQMTALSETAKIIGKLKFS